MTADFQPTAHAVGTAGEDWTVVMDGARFLARTNHVLKTKIVVDGITGE